MNIRTIPSKIRTAAGILHGRRAFGGPVQANLRLTNRCNIRCIHCYYNSPFLETPAFNPLRRAKMMHQELPSSNEMKDFLKIDADPQRMRTLIDELLKLGTRSWQVGGNGEPFLYKDILELIGILKRSGSHCLANTNGTLINAAVADELIHMQLDELRITTMAGTPEMYARTHAGIPDEMFNTLKENLAYIVRQRSALQVRRPEITLVFIVIAQNHDHLFDFAEFAVKIGADRVFFRPVDDIGDPGLANVVPLAKQAASVWEQLKEVEPFLASQGVDHNIHYFKKIFREQLNTETLYRIIPCYYGWLSTFIDPDGTVYPCCRCYDPLGNVNDKSFKEIWNGVPYQNFRQKALHINRTGKPLQGCDCYSCVHHTANLKAFQALHPLKRFSGHLNSLSCNDGRGAK